jgi:hypothetical protein
VFPGSLGCVWKLLGCFAVDSGGTDLSYRADPAGAARTWRFGSAGLLVAGGFLNVRAHARSRPENVVSVH